MQLLSNINIKNRRATFDYEIVETYTAGIVLTGTEIKSIRLGRASLNDSFALFLNGELWVRNMYVAEYALGTFYNHAVRRDRKLLLTHKELSKMARSTKDVGFTFIPLRLFINGKGLAKLVIAVARGKKLYDKRQSIREREDQRELDRMRKR